LSTERLFSHLPGSFALHRYSLVRDNGERGSEADFVHRDAYSASNEPMANSNRWRRPLGMMARNASYLLSLDEANYAQAFSYISIDLLIDTDLAVANLNAIGEYVTLYGAQSTRAQHILALSILNDIKDSFENRRQQRLDNTATVRALVALGVVGLNKFVELYNSGATIMGTDTTFDSIVHPSILKEAINALSANTCESSNFSSVR